MVRLVVLLTNDVDVYEYILRIRQAYWVFMWFRVNNNYENYVPRLFLAYGGQLSRTQKRNGAWCSTSTRQLANHLHKACQTMSVLVTINLECELSWLDKDGKVGLAKRKLANIGHESFRWTRGRQVTYENLDSDPSSAQSVPRDCLDIRCFDSAPSSRSRA